MSDVLVFPDTKNAIFELLEGTEHSVPVIEYQLVDGEYVPEHKVISVAVHPTYRLDAIVDGTLDLSKGAQVLITVNPGTQGFIDRVDRISLDVYAESGQALNIANSVAGFLVSDALPVEELLIDSIEIDQSPHDVPWQSDRADRAEMQLLVTVRPIE